DSAADGMLVCSLDGRVRAFNQRLATIWRIPRELLVQRNDAAVYAHMAAQMSDPVSYLDRLAVMAREPLLECSDLLQLRNGATVERRVVPQLHKGRSVGRVYSFRDVTQQVEVEMRLRLAARVFDSSLDAIFIADLQNRLVRMNPACERLVGAAAADMQGRSAAAWFESEAPAPWMASIQSAWAQDGFWAGELTLVRSNRTHCPVHLSWVAVRDGQGQWVQTIGFLRDLTQQRADQKRIEELAYSDVLTQLPNRLLLVQRVDAAIDQAAACGGEFAVLFLDVDRFKNINDSLGHSFGDRVLQLVALRLQASLRPQDMLCRLGGDEFVVYAPQANARVAEGLARHILEDMLRPFTLDEMGLSVQCSIGIALYPQNGPSLEDLIKHADTAMYRAKEKGRSSYSFYQPQMNAHLLTRMRLEHALRQALGEGRLEIHYQPQIGIPTGCITGAEALIRWTDPEFGTVPPGIFVPLAEESGYIIPMGQWVMETAVRDAAQWMREGHPTVVAVNVSALEFRQPDFVEKLTRLLATHQFPPALLELELTETILLHDGMEMVHRLERLDHLGVSLAIDDFGTGYSSLAYLKKLPIHKLKVDQSFVCGLPDDAGDQAIIAAIIHMGHALDIEVVAEGVENTDQYAQLQQMQCDHYQGFLCSPSLPASAFRERLYREGPSPWQCPALLPPVP
ncbi:MAG: EAL domain-containing protein, partial [Burkholderiaceae bacterium]|nr:EAL domain-containing protein [Burkholderiaceae bacterium]